jgi:site-specific recombinase XerC
MRNDSNMSEKDALHMVCLEPLLFSFQAPRTIASTLTEYENYLHTERGLPARRVRATMRSLERLLDPLDAPLVSLTREMAHALLCHEDGPEDLGPTQSISVRCLSHLRARRFFRFAIARGYVNSNPFDGIQVPLVESPQTEWLA